MEYEINVSLNGQHFFATHERSIRGQHQLETKLRVLKEKFTKEEGYEINVTRWERTGRFLSIEEILK